ncbi:MAG: sodium/proline symporter [Balneolaceae bacterium]
MQETGAISIGTDVQTLYAFIGYLLLLISIGLYSTRFSSTGISEFFIGGRTMNKFVIALSAVVSGRSAWLLIGVTGLVYARGISGVWAVVGYTLVELILFFTYAKRIREFSEKHDCITVPDFFAERFGDKNGTLRSLLIFTLLIFMISYVSAQLVAGGKAFSSSFGLEQNMGVLLSAGIILIYTVLGGFLAVSLTDVFQAFFMILALIFLPVIAIQELGGWGILTEQLNLQEVTLIDPFALTIGVFIGFIGIGLGSIGSPHIISRYMAIDDPKNLKFAGLVGTFWNIVMGAGAVLIGLVGRAYFMDVNMLPGADIENLYPYLAQLHLSPILFGIVLASIFAAIMSTADSQLLVAASSVVRDWYQKILKKDEEITPKKLVLYSRLVIVGLVLLALVFGLIAEDLVYWLVLFAWAGLGASIGPTSILALYWQGTTKKGVMAGIVTGTLVTIIWYFVPILKNAMYELIPAFIASLVVTILVSRVTKNED